LITKPKYTRNLLDASHDYILTKDNITNQLGNFADTLYQGFSKEELSGYVSFKIKPNPGFKYDKDSK
jgi:hypothetical protein